MKLKKPDFSPTLLIASNGDTWYYNCGWWRSKDRGQKPPMGHTAFRKCIPILEHEEETAKTVLLGVDKPQRHWRRLTGNCKQMTHKLYGTIKLLATDGCHAIVTGPLGKKTVSFESLTELPSKGNFSTGKKVKKKPKVGSLVNETHHSREMFVAKRHESGKTFLCEWEDEGVKIEKWFHSDNLTVISPPKKTNTKKSTKPRQTSEDIVNKYMHLLG